MSSIRIVTVLCLVAPAAARRASGRPAAANQRRGVPRWRQSCWPQRQPQDGINTTIQGNIIAVDRETDVELTLPFEQQRRLILYVYRRAGQYRGLAKVIIEEPGPYEVTLEGYVGTFDVSLVVDDNNNQFIDAGDTARGMPQPAAGGRQHPRGR